MIAKKYKRNSSNTTVSVFCEQDAMKKYNYDPPYQRDYNVWDISQKSLLIDTIMKNFPMPPIFLQQIIEKGKTRYDVIDGKQRLNTIKEFVNDKVPLPKSFGDDDYGISVMNGLRYSEIEKMAKTNPDVEEFLDVFWSYTISVEYIERTDEENVIVDQIFDRLNRGGERLNPAELRKASYYDTILYQEIERVAKEPVVSKALSDLSNVRMKNIEFVTEVFLMAIKRENITGEADKIDVIFEEQVESATKDEIMITAENVIKAFEVFGSFKLNLTKYQIRGTSHLYALLYLSYSIVINKVQVNNGFTEKLNEFYMELRDKNRKNQDCISYSESMQAQTKSKSARKKRVIALCHYMGVETL